MTRTMLCEKCAFKYRLHPEDFMNGYHMRKVWLRATSSIVCDTCNVPLNGQLVAAATLWRGPVDPPDWERDYGTPTAELDRQEGKG